MVNQRAGQIRNAMEGFLRKRLAERIAKLSPDDPKYEKETNDHVLDTWLQKMQEQVQQIQVVTHPLRLTHSGISIKDATNLYCHPNSLIKHQYLTTASLADNFFEDVTGNAAALSSYSFLLTEFEDKRLLDLLLTKDADFVAALHEDPATAESYLDALLVITQPKAEKLASHVLAKQLYWLNSIAAADNDCVSPYHDKDFTLLAPLSSSSLAHEMYLQIESARFSEESKSLRDARRTNKAVDGVLYSYPNLAVQIIGGANPQNVSVLNSKRKGTNYLLASLPPQWKEADVKMPWHAHSVFKLFSSRRSVIALVGELKTFLNTDPKPNLETRTYVSGTVDSLLDELLIFAQELQQVEAGWSLDKRCQLSLSQTYWLDIKRCITDADFKQAWILEPWPEQIATDFANWLNSKLESKLLQFGDVEFRRWAKQLKRYEGWRNQLDELSAQLEEYENGAN